MADTGTETDMHLDTWLLRRIEPERSALLVIDFQNDFCAEGGWYDEIGYDLTMGQRAARRAAEFLPVARANRLLVIFARCVYDQPYMSRVMRETYEHNGVRAEYCIDGSWGGDFYVIAPEPEDLIVTKHRYSAFLDTNLEAILRSNDIENLLFAGVATNVCVDSTARDAQMRDYRVTVLEDCCGTYDRTLHDATMETIRRAFGVVTSSGIVERAWAATRPPSEVPAAG